jgi:hypothetical protein
MLGGSKETDNAADFEYDMKEATTHVGANRNPVIVTTTKRINDEAMRMVHYRQTACQNGVCVDFHVCSTYIGTSISFFNVGGRSVVSYVVRLPLPLPAEHAQH